MVSKTPDIVPDEISLKVKEIFGDIENFKCNGRIVFVINDNILCVFNTIDDVQKTHDDIYGKKTED